MIKQHLANQRNLNQQFKAKILEALGNPPESVVVRPPSIEPLYSPAYIVPDDGSRGPWTGSNKKPGEVYQPPSQMLLTADCGKGVTAFIIEDCSSLSIIGGRAIFNHLLRFVYPVVPHHTPMKWFNYELTPEWTTLDKFEFVIPSGHMARFTGFARKTEDNLTVYVIKSEWPLDIETGEPADKPAMPKPRHVVHRPAVKNAGPSIILN